MVMDMDKKAKKNHISYKKEKAVEKPFIKI